MNGSYLASGGGARDRRHAVGNHKRERQGLERVRGMRKIHFVHAGWVFSQEEVRFLKDTRSEAREIGKGDLRSDHGAVCKLGWVTMGRRGRVTGY